MLTTQEDFRGFPPPRMARIGADERAHLRPSVEAGTLILLWCLRDLSAAGKGTLAPWDPPTRLVVVGLYRYTRHPMYLGILILLSGWSAWSGSLLLAENALIPGMAFRLRVVLDEEPVLARQFGPEWDIYACTVPRWLFPRRH